MMDVVQVYNISIRISVEFSKSFLFHVVTFLLCAYVIQLGFAYVNKKKRGAGKSLFQQQPPAPLRQAFILLQTY